MRLTTHTVEVAPMYAQAFHKEDGSPIVYDVFHVWVTAADGQRWEHEQAFPGLVWVRDDAMDYGGYYQPQHKEALAAAERLVARILARGWIHLDNWREIDPAYGSTQYVSQDIEFHRVMEERAEG